MFCGKCGKQIDDRAKFCPYCGTGTGIEPTNKRSDQTKESHVHQSGKKGKSSKIRAGIVVAGVVCVCAVVGGVLFFKKEYDLEKNGKETTLLEESKVEESLVADNSMEESEGTEETTIEETGAESESAEETEVVNTETESMEETDADTDESKPVFGSLTDDYILPECATRYYDPNELEGISFDELYIARNEIYARHGRTFKNEKLNEYFQSKSWYTPLYTPEEFDKMGDSVFNEYEIANRNILLELEKVIEQ